MERLREHHRSTLSDLFGKRVSFNRVERTLYGHDIAAIPALVRPLIGKTVPDAVVQPEREEELVELVGWAAKHRIPLTPRGKATSGYGGAIPVEQGIVVDFYRMKKLLEVDPEARTVTVQAGIVWEKLDRELEKQGLTLLSYPTSYPSSTAAGWLAQGGVGIGSFEAGWFRDYVTRVRVDINKDGSALSGVTVIVKDGDTDSEFPLTEEGSGNDVSYARPARIRGSCRERSRRSWTASCRSGPSSSSIPAWRS